MNIIDFLKKFGLIRVEKGSWSGNQEDRNDADLPDNHIDSSMND